MHMNKEDKEELRFVARVFAIVLTRFLILIAGIAGITLVLKHYLG